MSEQTLCTVPAKQVKLSDVVKIIEKKGAYRFMVVDKDYQNDVTVMDSMISQFGIKTIQLSK